MYIKVKDTPDLVRDDKSGALLNTNPESLEAYKKRRNSQVAVSKLVDDLNDLRGEFKEIKTMLAHINNMIGTITNK